MIENTAHVNQVVDDWENSYKKGLLTFWVLLALHNGPKHMRQIKLYIEHECHSNISADEKSLYRSISRFNKLDLISSHKQQSDAGGPDYKAYQLTNAGRQSLQLFYQRNIADVFLTPGFQDEVQGL